MAKLQRPAYWQQRALPLPAGMKGQIPSEGHS